MRLRILHVGDSGAPCDLVRLEHGRRKKCVITRLFSLLSLQKLRPHGAAKSCYSKNRSPDMDRSEFLEYSKLSEERVGFEPTERSSRSAVFKTAALNRSATSPHPNIA